MKTLKNICIDQIRKDKKRSNGAMPSDLPVGETRYEEHDMVNLLKNRMHALPVQQKMIVELKDFQGFSYEEISEILNLPVNTIRVNLSRARKQLITGLKNDWQ